MENDPNKEWNDFEKGLGYKEYQFKINITKAIDFVKNRFKKKERCNRKENKWVYECGCTATPEAYRTMPYCPVHGMKLIIKEG